MLQLDGKARALKREPEMDNGHARDRLGPFLNYLQKICEVNRGFAWKNL